MLAQLRWKQQELYREIAEEASDRCLESDNVDVLVSALAVRKFREFRHTDRVHELARHSVSVLRLNVAKITPHKDEASEIELLTELSRDPDSDVRDWATFGLGQMYSEHSGEGLLQALEARFTDSDVSVRFEAYCGFGMRLDEDWFDDLDFDERFNLLSDPAVRDWKILAALAERFPDPRWVAPLELLLADKDSEEGWEELRAALDLNTKA